MHFGRAEFGPSVVRGKDQTIIMDPVRLAIQLHKTPEREWLGSVLLWIPTYLRLRAH